MGSSSGNLYAGIGEGQSTSRPPLFDGTNYTYWKEWMRIYIRSTNFELWLVIKNGEEMPMKKVGEKLVPKTEDEFDAEDVKKVENYAKAINMLYCAVNPVDYRKISCCTIAKEMWDKLEVTYKGTAQVWEAKIDFLMQEYEMFMMKEGEKINDMFDRFSKIINDLHALKKTYTNKDFTKQANIRDYYESHGDQYDYGQHGPTYDYQPNPYEEELRGAENRSEELDEELMNEDPSYQPPPLHNYNDHSVAFKLEWNKRAIEWRFNQIAQLREERAQRERDAKEFYDKENEVRELDRLLAMHNVFFMSPAYDREWEPHQLDQEEIYLDPILEDSQEPAPAQEPEYSMTQPLLTQAIVMELPECPPSGKVVHKVEPTKESDSEPPLQSPIEEKDEENVPVTIDSPLLICVEDIPPEEPILEEIEPTTYPLDSKESKEESIDEKILFSEDPTPSIETSVINASPVDFDKSSSTHYLAGVQDVIVIEPQLDRQPIKGSIEINLATKANVVDLLRIPPPPPTNYKSPLFILLPPSRKEKSRILDLGYANCQSRLHQKSMDAAWMIPHGDQRTLRDLDALPFTSDEAKKKFLIWGNQKSLQPPLVLDPATLIESGYWEEIDEFLYDPKWRVLLFLRAAASLELTVEFLCSLQFFNKEEEVKAPAKVTYATTIPVNVATFVARFLFGQSDTEDQGVLCGPLVTLLAQGLKMQVANVIPEPLSVFRPHVGYLVQIAYSKKDEEERPKKQRTIPMTLRELSHAIFAFQDSVESRLGKIEVMVETQQWQVEEIMDFVVEQRVRKERKAKLKEDAKTKKH
ncbi:unnamed protein product [Cuscuta campestris]|uniref:DUF4219 domain-containing protein n=1 Tax=Cuscuta campestris TaxID=132261 RepID=A0A484LJ38_9ASTE|nr:unnamed protein product [Cuscuta campestris]